MRIDEESRTILQEIKAQEDASATAIIHMALEEYRRKLFLRKCGHAYAALKSDDKAWAVELDERAAWEAAMGDGLDKDKS